MSTETQQASAPAAPTKATPPADAPAAAPLPEAAAEAVAAAPAEAGAGAEGQALEDGVAALVIAQPQAELHRACAEGRLEDVRSILAQGLDALETLDPATAMTPIVLAIQNGQADVVRELLAAGAIVPPPGVTGDPAMLSILYPQPMYGVPPPFTQMAPPQFYTPQGFYHPVRSAPNGAAPNGSSANGSAPNGAANLPPAEVAKTIPCRNFPNCKYGASCMFFHPRPQNPGFFPAPFGYEGFVPYPGSVPFFPGPQEFVQPSNTQASGEGEVAAPATAEDAMPAANGDAVPVNPTTQHDSIPAGAHVPSAVAPAFIPMRPDGQAPYNGFAMSPTLLPTSPSHLPADAFFATSPPQFQPFVPNGYASGHPRRQSFGQFPPNGVSKGYHGKKPSFSGGPKPWGPGGRPGGSSHLGVWKDGHPPPCAFFREGKCRNGEFCKFPHLDADGNDVRHPDVVRGIIPPIPTPRIRNGMRMMGGAGHYDPRHQFNGKQAAAAQSVAEDAEDAEVAAETSAEASPRIEKETSAPATPAPVSAAASATLPPKPSSSVPPSRSTSQPGNSRMANSRSHSPNGPSGPRRGPRYANGQANGQANGSRSSSAHADKKALPPQRIPRADEFPALGLSASSTPTIERREPSWGNKTAAQVLSEPAPVKAVPAPAKEESEEKQSEDKSSDGVTMDSDSEQDAVIVSVSTTPNPEVAKAKLASAVSFASVAGVTVDAAPVALKV